MFFRYVTYVNINICCHWAPNFFPRLLECQHIFCQNISFTYLFAFGSFAFLFSMFSSFFFFSPSPLLFQSHRNILICFPIIHPQFFFMNNIRKYDLKWVGWKYIMIVFYYYLWFSNIIFLLKNRSYFIIFYHSKNMIKYDIFWRQKISYFLS